MLTFFYIMENETISLIAFITQASWSQFENAKVFNDVHHQDFEYDLPITTTLPHPLFAGINLDALTGFKVKHTPERQAKLEQFIYNITPAQFHWLDQARATEWHDADWKTNASHLFVTAESMGVSGTASYAILAALMAVQGFPLPANLAGCLSVAKQVVAKNREDLAHAEKRRATELNRKEMK